MTRLLIRTAGALGTLLLIGCGLFSSADREAQIPEQYVTATLNGAPWTAQTAYLEAEDAPLSSWVPGEYLSLMVLNQDVQRYPYYESLMMGAPSPEPGLQVAVEPVPSIARGGWFVEADGDAFIATYHPTPDSSNVIEITRHDPDAQVVEGRFQLTLAVSPDYRDVAERQRPDTLRFTDGRFRLWYEVHELDQ